MANVKRRKVLLRPEQKGRTETDIHPNTTWTLDQSDSKFFASILINPPKAGASLSDAARKYMRNRRGK